MPAIRVSAFAALAAAGLSVAALLPLPALAQSESERLERLERDVEDLVEAVFRGNAVPRDGGSETAVAPGRLNDVEAALRNLTGQVEQLSFQLREAQERIQVLEQELALTRGTPMPMSGPSDPVSPQPGRRADAAGAPQPLPKPGDLPSQAPAASGTLGTMPSRQLEEALANQPTVPVETPGAGTPGAGTPAAGQQTASLAPAPGGAYQEAMDLLSRAQYDAARERFTTFADENPKDPLADDARYWVGDIRFIQKDYTGAAKAYTELLQAYPKSERGPDAMVQLGRALVALDKKQEGCAALGAIRNQFPNAKADVLARATRERRAAGCA